MRHENVEIVFVSPNGVMGFSVKKEQLPPPSPKLTRTTIKNFATEAAAIAFGEQYAKSKKRQLIVLDATAIPSRWATW